MKLGWGQIKKDFVNEEFGFYLEHNRELWREFKQGHSRPRFAFPKEQSGCGDKRQLKEGKLGIFPVAWSGGERILK